MTPQDILNFWFEELEPADHWKKSNALDATIRERFQDIHARAADCELADWREHIEGRLAEIIILDQFSRNMFRDTPRAFATDPLALALAQEAVRAGGYEDWPDMRKAFLFMPFMHSESQAVQERAIELFTSLGNEQNLEYAIRHKAIIDRFGRYPHRNEILGRASTEEELAFLEQPNSSF